MEDRREETEDPSGGPDRGGVGSAGEEAESNVVTVEWADVEDPCVDIVEAVATATGRDPVDLPPLGHAVECDAVTTLLGDGRDTDVRLSFWYAGRSVVVDRGGTIEVSPAAD